MYAGPSCPECINDVMGVQDVNTVEFFANDDDIIN